MGDTGLEPAAKTKGKTDIDPGALPKAPQVASGDPRLLAVVEAWPNLSDPVKVAIVAMVEISTNRDRSSESAESADGSRGAVI